MSLKWPEIHISQSLSPESFVTPPWPWKQQVTSAIPSFLRRMICQVCLGQETILIRLLNTWISGKQFAEYFLPNIHHIAYYRRCYTTWQERCEEKAHHARASCRCLDKLLHIATDNQQKAPNFLTGLPWWSKPRLGRSNPDWRLTRLVSRSCTHAWFE